MITHASKALPQLIRIWWPTAVASVFALLLVLNVALQRLDYLQQNMDGDLAEAVSDQGRNVRERFVYLHQVLAGTRALVSTLGHVGDHEWRRFTADLDLPIQAPEATAIGFALRVEPGKLNQHIDRVRASGLPDYDVAIPAENFSFLAPVVRLTPGEQGRTRLKMGTNLASDSKVSEVLKGLLAQGSTQAIGCRDTAIKDGGANDQDCIMLIEPVTVRTIVNQTSQPSETEVIQGWVFMLVSLSQLVNSTEEARPGVYHAEVSLSHPQQNPAQQRSIEKDLELSIFGLTIHLSVRPLHADTLPWRAIVTGELTTAVLIGMLTVLTTVFVTRAKLQSARLTKLANELKASEESYRFLATHDPLTGVANRAMLISRLSAVASEAARYDHRFGLIYFDLDKFKQVNDTLGHHVGDLLLVAVVERVQAVLRESDLLARNGGDEFVVLLPHVREEADICAVATKIRDALIQPFTLESHCVQIGSSLGVALAVDNSIPNIDDLLQTADDRMYLAKRAGGNRVVGAEQAAEPPSRD